MRAKFTNQGVLGILLILQCATCIATESPDANDSTKYLDAVREFADNVLKYGRDTYGPKHTPLFVDGLNIHTHEPVKWISPKGDWRTATETEEWILSNFASQQTLLRTLDGLSSVTGDPKYRQAAMDAIRYMFDHVRTPNGLFYWGHGAAYDAQTDKVWGSTHCLKIDYPHYDLMWKVDPNKTKRFIEAYWSAHVNDWSNLDFNRFVRIGLHLEEPWNHEYKGGPTFFKSKHGGGGFFTTATSLVHAGTTLHRLSHEEQPLVWSNRLVKRFVDTRNPITGIGTYLYNRLPPRPPLGDDLKEHFRDPRTMSFPFEPFEEIRGIYYPKDAAIEAHQTVSLFRVGKSLGNQGKQFIQWALEELIAWGTASYRKKDNSFVPILTDGTNIEGYVSKKSNSYGPKGAVAKPRFADLSFFWAYAVAYRATGDAYMWEMTRDIALGNLFGDIGRHPEDPPELETDTACSDVYALLSFLELYERTNSPSFLRMARRIGDNIVENQLHNGFFVPSEKHIYTRFDCFEPLALLHLVAAIESKSGSVPQVWPSCPLFAQPYRHKQEGVDRRVIYALTESTEPPLSLQEAAAIGDFELVRSLLEKGVGVDSWDDSLGKTAFHRAAISGHKDVVELLLAKGADIGAGKFHVGTALHYAAEKGHKEVAELLIAKGADVNATDSRGDTPLHRAARAGHKDVIDLLVAKKADVNAKNNDGQTPLDIALSRNRREIVELLQSEGATIDISSIHVAAKWGDLAKVQAFLENGTDINAADDKGLTPLHHAAMRGHKEVVEFLIAKGADINIKDKYGYTPLYYAIWFENKDIVKLLVTKGADVNLKPEKDYPPLHYAVWQDETDIVKLLVTNGARFDVKDQDGWTAFRYAAWQGNRDIVEFFVAKGADVSIFHGAACVGDLARIKDFIEKGTDIDTKDELGWTPLYWAASTRQEEVAEFLITKGADVGAKVEDSSTPLHQAARAGAIKLVKLLIDKGADVNGKDKRGNTPLHSAASAGHRQIAELLIANGANVNAKTTNGWTALHRAALGGHRDVVEILISHGADVTVKDSRGRTAADWAGQRGHKEIVELLRKHEYK